MSGEEHSDHQNFRQQRQKRFVVRLRTRNFMNKIEDQPPMFSKLFFQGFVLLQTAVFSISSCDSQTQEFLL